MYKIFMLERSKNIAESFGRAVESYDDNAALQKHVAERLSGLLPEMFGNGNILEIGCGTGIFSDYLIKHYPEAKINFTDLSVEKLKFCENRLSKVPNSYFNVVDGCKIDDFNENRLDLIVSSMVVQWFNDPEKGIVRMLDLVNDGGNVLYATIGSDNFPEWKAAHEDNGVECRLLEMPKMPNVVLEENITVNYGCARDFRKMLHLTGANTSRVNVCDANKIGKMKDVIRHFDKNNGQATWNIVYGVLNK